MRDSKSDYKLKYCAYTAFLTSFVNIFTAWNDILNNCTRNFIENLINAQKLQDI